eukprot:Rhum_TRINITY_DN9029_c1_g1::Rhum_TRINITY_DN9029_c1_g1_i1::g.31238::m.31238
MSLVVVFFVCFFFGRLLARDRWRMHESVASEVASGKNLIGGAEGRIIEGVTPSFRVRRRWHHFSVVRIARNGGGGGEGVVEAREKERRKWCKGAPHPPLAFFLFISFFFGGGVSSSFSQLRSADEVREVGAARVRGLGAFPLHAKTSAVIGLPHSIHQRTTCREEVSHRSGKAVTGTGRVDHLLLGHGRRRHVHGGGCVSLQHDGALAAHRDDHLRVLVHNPVAQVQRRLLALLQPVDGVSEQDGRLVLVRGHDRHVLHHRPHQRHLLGRGRRGRDEHRHLSRLRRRLQRPQVRGEGHLVLTDDDIRAVEPLCGGDELRRDAVGGVGADDDRVLAVLVDGDVGDAGALTVNALQVGGVDALLLEVVDVVQAVAVGADTTDHAALAAQLADHHRHVAALSAVALLEAVRVKRLATLRKAVDEGDVVHEACADHGKVKRRHCLEECVCRRKPLLCNEVQIL